ncbi:uncharacterized protein LOC142335208 [Convolutriloba macropyga]|uniref:uncharacterized protein LOC142335208 n=1 Tax=Convolutriloba macropyga TaxID=536237 RepID=UPI003F527B28
MTDSCFPAVTEGGDRMGESVGDGCGSAVISDSGCSSLASSSPNTSTSSSSNDELVVSGCSSVPSNGVTSAAKSKRNYKRQENKPPFSYQALIIAAIWTSEAQQMTLREIFVFLEKSFSFFRGSYRGWRDSIRHNLTSSCVFEKVLKDPSKPTKKSNFWKVRQEHMAVVVQKDVSAIQQLLNLKHNNNHTNITRNNKINNNSQWELKENVMNNHDATETRNMNLSSISFNSNISNYNSSHVWNTTNQRTYNNDVTANGLYPRANNNFSQSNSSNDFNNFNSNFKLHNPLMVDTSNLGPSECGTGSKTGLVNRDIGNINQPDTEKSSALNGRKRQKSKGFMMESILKTPFQKKQNLLNETASTSTPVHNFHLPQNHFTPEMSQSVLRKYTTWDQLPSFFQSSKVPELALGSNNGESQPMAKFQSGFNTTQNHDHHQGYSGAVHGGYMLPPAIQISPVQSAKLSERTGSEFWNREDSHVWNSVVGTTQQQFRSQTNVPQMMENKNYSHHLSCLQNLTNLYF